MPLVVVPILGFKNLIWLLPIMAVIFIFDRMLDGRYGILTPMDNDHASQEGEQAVDVNRP